MDTRKLNDTLTEIADLMYSEYLDSYYKQILASMYEQLLQYAENLEREEAYDKRIQGTRTTLIWIFK